MIPNGVRLRWTEGKPVINGWLSTSSAFVAEIMSAQGYDSLTIDLQHGLVGYEAADRHAAGHAGRAASRPWCACPGLIPATS